MGEGGKEFNIATCCRDIEEPGIQEQGLGQGLGPLQVREGVGQEGRCHHLPAPGNLGVRNRVEK